MKYLVLITIFVFSINNVGCVDERVNKKKFNFFKTAVGSFQCALGTVMTVYSVTEISKSIKEQLPFATIIDKNSYDFLGAFFGINIIHVGWQRVMQKNYSSSFFKIQKLFCDPITFYHAKYLGFFAYRSIKTLLFSKKKT